MEVENTDRSYKYYLTCHIPNILVFFFVILNVQLCSCILVRNSRLYCKKTIYIFIISSSIFSPEIFPAGFVSQVESFQHLSASTLFEIACRVASNYPANSSSVGRYLQMPKIASTYFAHIYR